MEHLQILKELDKIEEKHGVKIFYAVESGSRAWGFNSINSDYDIRFLYLHPPSWYLSVDLRRDVIEYPGDQLDLSGWDMLKAFRLFMKSNPPLFEWLESPIIYLERYEITKKLRALAKDYLFSKACLYHYLHMAIGNNRDYLQGEDVLLKKYLYVLRPILACMWIEKNNTFPPMEFQILVDSLTFGEHKEDINRLLAIKKSGQEMDRGPRIDSISNFINTKISHFKNNIGDMGDYTQDPALYLEKINRLFIESLKEVWGNLYD